MSIGTGSLEPAGGAAAGMRGEVHLAFWNALKIGGSLLATWSVALGVRLLLPRHLGPDSFGVYNFADAFAASFLAFATLGIDTYIQKEIPVRATHASDFFGGLLLLRLLLSGLLIAAMAVVMDATHRPPEVQRVVLLFALGHMLFVTNSTLAALLEARGTVDGLSVANVTAKLLWGGGMLVALFAGSGPAGLAAAFAASEAIKAVALQALCRRHLRLEMVLRLSATGAALRASLPFFIGTLSFTLYSKLDVSILAFLGNEREVGWYGLASGLANMALLLTPLITSVLLPLFARAAARSDEELDAVLRRALEAVLALAIPISLALGLGADVWIRLTGGAEFMPATPAMRVLAPVFVLTYVAILCASCLNLIGRAWTATSICLLGALVNPALNVLLIPTLGARLGPGGGSLATAISTLGQEGLICGLLLAAIGRRLVDRRVLSALARSLGVCAGVIALDQGLATLGAWRLVPDALAYCVLAVLTRAVRVPELLEIARAARKERRQVC